MIWACSIASGRTATRPIKESWNLIRAVALVAQGTLLADTPRAAPGYEAGQARAERLFAAITAQGARLPSQRRFEARERSEREGVKVPRALYDDVLKLLD